jgi:hypothetical protein
MQHRGPCIGNGKRRACINHEASKTFKKKKGIYLYPEEKRMEKKIILKYEPPKIITYSEDDILEEMGPAQACSPSPCPVAP